MRIKRLLALFCAVCWLISGVAYAAGEELIDPESGLPVQSAVTTTEETAASSVTQAAQPAVYPSSHKVTVNGAAVSPQCYTIDGYNYFKLRDIALLLSGTGSAFDVEWNNSTKTINLVSGSDYTAVGGELAVVSASSLRVYDSVSPLLLNGSTVSIKGYLLGGNNYYKIADMAAALGFSVSFDNDTRTVQIVTAEPEPEPEPTPEPEPEPEPEVFTPGIYQVKVDTSLTVRAGPGLTYQVIGKLSNGDEIVVDSLTDGWAHILDAGADTGRYCSADYLTRVKDYVGGTVDEPEVFTPGIYQVKVDSSLTVRAGPGFTYRVVGKLSNGDELVVDSLTGDWAHILDTETDTGRYCSADYLTRVKDYVGEEVEDPVQPPRTSHLDGRMTVIVDAGHGGSDIGAHNEDMSLDEKHVNLYVALYLQEYLENAGVDVIMVRDTLEDGSSLSLRGTVMEQYAASADLFFSVHHNAVNTVARGAEVLAQISDQNGGPSKTLAELLLEEYSALGLPIRSVVFREGSSGDYYYTNRVAASLQIPAVTSEFCFIDNEEDQKFIDSEADWKAEARAQYNAIMAYFDEVEY